MDESEALGEFWLDVARISDWRRGGWVLPVTRAAILGDAIGAMRHSYVRQIPMNQLGLTRDGDLAWFWRRRVCDVHDWPGSAPASPSPSSVRGRPSSRPPAASEPRGAPEEPRR